MRSWQRQGPPRLARAPEVGRLREGRRLQSACRLARCGVKLGIMKNVRPSTWLLLATLGVAPVTHAQDGDMETDSAIQRATDAAKKMGLPSPDVKKILEENDRQEARDKAAVQAAVDAPGPAALPDWTPKVPQFTPSGPVAKKVVNDEAKVVLSGTSPLTPAELADAWEAAVSTQKINHSRNNISSNGNLTTVVFLTTRTDPLQEVRLESRRAPGETISHVTILSPLAVAKPSDDDE